MNVSDLIITIAYFSIPLQILFSLWKYPRLARMPPAIFILAVLFAFFIFLCGAGHLLRCLDMTHTDAFTVINSLTAGISLITALYLLPLVPTLFGSIDQSLEDLVQLNEETTESKYKLFTFMAFLCHEIRNPLFAITSSASFLGDTEMTEEQEIGVGSIFDSSLLMLRLVNDVLDLSKIDAGKLELEERDFDLRRLLGNLETNMRMQISQKHEGKVELRFSVSSDVPRIVHGDSVRMLQIVYNLLSNSSKFTSEGHIDLDVTAGEEDSGESAPATGWKSKRSSLTHEEGKSKRESLTLDDLCDDDADDNNAESTNFSMALLASAEEGQAREQSQDQEHQVVNLTIVVADTGIGIDPDRLETIFKPYSQAKLSDYRKHGGTGLGLSILSSLTKIMGGSISVTSKVGEGSRFVLKLPIKLAHNQNVVIEDSTDMTDPFLSCQRLPVYTKQEDANGRDIPALSTSSTALHSDAGIQFFDSPNDSKPLLQASTEEEKKQKEEEEEKAVTLPTKPKAKKKKPKLPTFNLPSGTYVLVVDDNCVNRKIIGKMLKFFNIEYKEAVNGVEAVDAMKSSRNATGNPSEPHFGLVFMDLSMPIMDGYEAIEEIRKQHIYVPIIALTANALSQERDRALEAGANEFHTKPILRNDLHTICTRFLHPMSIAEETAPDMAGTDSVSTGESASRVGLKECSPSLGESFREGVSLLVRHDSVVARNA